LIASATLLLVASALVTFNQWSRRPPVPAPRPEPKTYATGNGERAELRLTDGTRIRIAPASRLRVAADFGVDRRDVYLEGEAYFDVVHDEQRPFTVFAGNASAQDLGTQFTVRSYADDGAVQVVVRKGAVAMSGVGRLAPGDLGRLGADGRTTLKHGVSVGAYTAWLDGRLVFRDTPLAEVLRTLGRWHDVDVRMADSSLATMPFTGELADASASASIDLVSRVLGLRARRAGTVITLERIPELDPRTHPGSGGTHP
jgi:ferric-dicitrate binding protein FerR (iron transport regulator)